MTDANWEINGKFEFFFKFKLSGRSSCFSFLLISNKFVKKIHLTSLKIHLIFIDFAITVAQQAWQKFLKKETKNETLWNVCLKSLYYAPVSINKLNFPNSPSSALTRVKWREESTKHFQSVLFGACPRRILLVDLDTKEMLPPTDLHYRYTLFRSTEAAILNPSVVWRNSSELKVIWFSLPLKVEQFN